ncbi:nucleotide-binding protein [Nocardia sp. R6R-6]|uniref:nucleotide-binding protein n=1 Tax=Nocardia sp. R6R-6 TaxID=3459303 RepID=UPI00403D593F
MSRNNDLPMLPPWLSDSEVTGGYEAPVQNLPHEELIDDAPDRKRRRRAQAPDGRNDANQGSGRRDKKRRWLGRDKDELVEEQPSAPTAGEQRGPEPPADSWGQPPSGWSSGADAEPGRPGDSPQQATRGQADRNESRQQTEGPVRQQPSGGPDHPAPPRFDAHGQPPQTSHVPGPPPPQQFGGPGQPIGGPGQTRPEQFGGPGQPQQQTSGPGYPQQPVGDGGPQWSGGPQQHGGQGQPAYQQTGMPGYPQPMGGPGHQPQQPIGGPGQSTVDGSSQVAQPPGEAWARQPHPDDPRSSAPRRAGGHSSLPTRQPSQPSEGFQPLGQAIPTPPFPAPEPPPSHEATTHHQRSLPDLPPPPSDVRPSPAAEDSSARTVGDPQAGHSVTGVAAENHVADSPAEHHIPAGDLVAPPAAVNHAPARADTGPGSASTVPDHISVAAIENHAAADAERPNVVPRPVGDEVAPRSSTAEGTESGIPPHPDDFGQGPSAVGRGRVDEFTRNTAGTAEDAESAREGRHRLSAEPEPSERPSDAPGPAQGGHRAPVSDQPAPGDVRRNPGVFAQQGGGEMPWTQVGFGTQPPSPQNAPRPGYGYADQRQGGYDPTPGPDANAYHIPGDRSPRESGYPTQSGPGTVEPANNPPPFVAPPAADQQPPAPPSSNQGTQPPAPPQGPTGESWGRPQHGPAGEGWGQQPQGGPRRPQQGQPSLDDVPLRRAKKSPGSGWRKAVHHMSGGAINPGMSAEELRLQELVARIRQPVRGDYRIAVLSLKGGVGKTTTTVGLGSIFASVRGDRVIAVDANPDFGTLSQRVPLQTRSTVRDLLLDPSIERYSDVRRHTSQATSRLEVLASERDPAASEAFNDDEYRAVARILQRYYNIILTDCGTGLMHSAMAGVLDLAHSLVLISSAAIDGARSAAATLDWLSLHGHDHLVRNAVVVINLPREGSPNVGVQQLREYFLSRCRAVHIIPYDAHLSEGAEIDLHRLSKQAKRAYVELAATVADEFSVDHRRFHS